VVLGHKGLVLFPSLDRLVSFLRAYGEEGSIDELLPSMEIRRLITPLRTRELALILAAESSYRMDRVAGIAKLAGGLVFTGTSRHFVRYRDVASPLGYDVQELLAQKADLIVYDESFQQTYEFEREISLYDLILKLTPYRTPPSERRAPTRLFATAEVGLSGALLSYLFRWEIDARAALAEWPSQSAFEDAPRRLYVLSLVSVPARVVALLQAVPGVTVFEPQGERVGVELDHRHPVALDSCPSLFEQDSLTLFRADGEVLVLRPLPPFAPVRTLVRSPIELSETPIGSGRELGGADLSMSLSLKLAATTEPWRSVVASVVPQAQRQWLARLLYALPPKTLGALRMAMGKHGIYLMDPAGIEGVPLGVYYSRVGDRIYVPCGQTLVPAVAPAVLDSLLLGRGDGHVFFGLDGIPRLVPEQAFGPVSQRALAQDMVVPVEYESFDFEEPPLPLFHYDEARRFPLWGVPAKAKPEGEEEGKA
jgi:hypothetical protein